MLKTTCFFLHKTFRMWSHTVLVTHCMPMTGIHCSPEHPGIQISIGQIRLFATWSYSSPPLQFHVSWLLQLHQKLPDAFPQNPVVPVGSSTDISHSPCWELGWMPAVWELPCLVEQSQKQWRRCCLLLLLSSVPRASLWFGFRSSSSESLIKFSP